MENSILPNEKWTVKQMKDYIREKKLNKTKIVLLGMKRDDMIEGLKKVKHFELPSYEIISKLGNDMSHLHNIIWDIEEIIIKYLTYRRHLYSLTWGQLAKIYRLSYKSQNPGNRCSIPRSITPIRLSNLLIKDFPQLTIEDFPKIPNKDPILIYDCKITLHEIDHEVIQRIIYMMMYFGWRKIRDEHSQWARVIDQRSISRCVDDGIYTEELTFCKWDTRRFEMSNITKIKKYVVKLKGNPITTIRNVRVYRDCEKTRINYCNHFPNKDTGFTY